ncbi:hypothetical protein, partial [uncultured Duncaniella sp.]|uniref:hypothetical protein n=1 Tax=uncultured Duncaniella sp. TaxID=2768039 RepID=UPI0025D3F059
RSRNGLKMPVSRRKSPSTADGIRIAERFGMKDHTFKMFLTRNLNTLFRRIRQGWYQKLSCYSANKVTTYEQD